MYTLDVVDQDRIAARVIHDYSCDWKYLAACDGVVTSMRVVEVERAT